MTVFRTIDPAELLMPVPEWIPDEILRRGFELFGVSRPAALYSHVCSAESTPRIIRAYDPWPAALRLSHEADAIAHLHRIEKGFQYLMKERAACIYVGEERIESDMSATAFAAYRLHIDRRLLPGLGFRLKVPALLQRYIEAEAAALRILSDTPPVDQPIDVWCSALAKTGLPEKCDLPEPEDSSW